MYILQIRLIIFALVYVILTTVNYFPLPKSHFRI
jgi:hypothetical protein